MDPATEAQAGADLIRSETGELTFDSMRGLLTVDTAMTAGGRAPAGGAIQTSSAIIRVLQTDATVWISSLDGQPIDRSRRLLITHLTELQNAGVIYAEETRDTVLEWGGLPYLLRAGSAEIVLTTEAARDLRVWALSTSGRRVGEVKTEQRHGKLIIPLVVKGPEGARMLYELATE